MAPSKLPLGAVLCLACLALGTMASPQSPSVTQAPSDASAVLAATRQALGGDAKLAAIKNFVASGRTRQVRGNNLVPIEFEILCELPDRYVRRDEIPAQESGPTASGFKGDTLIQVPMPPAMPPGPMPPGGAKAPAVAAAAAGVKLSGGQGDAPPVPSAPPPDPNAARVTTLKQDFARLTLGMFASSFSSYPLTFTLAGRAEAPQGTADVIDVKGPGTFKLRLFVNSATHLPIMVSWTVPATNVVVGVEGGKPPENVPPGAIVVQAPPLPPPTASKEEQEAYTKTVQELRKKALETAKPVEHRLYYADYREVDGLRLPFRIRRSIGGETTEETNFDGFKMNTRIDARKFESR